MTDLEEISLVGGEPIFYSLSGISMNQCVCLQGTYRIAQIKKEDILQSNHAITHAHSLGSRMSLKTFGGGLIYSRFTF